MPRIRMCDADRERYGGPEWAEIAMTELLDEETGLIEAIEEQWGLTPMEFLNQSSRMAVKAVRAMIWAGRRKAGCVDDPRTFRPKTQEWSGVVFEALPAEEKAWKEAQGRADADPPVPANRAAKRAAARPRKSTAASKT